MQSIFYEIELIKKKNHFLTIILKNSLKKRIFLEDFPRGPVNDFLKKEHIRCERTKNLSQSLDTLFFEKIVLDGKKVFEFLKIVEKKRYFFRKNPWRSLGKRQ